MNNVYIYKGSKKRFELFLKSKLGDKTYVLFLKEIYKLDSLRSLGFNISMTSESSEDDYKKVKETYLSSQDTKNNANMVIFADDYSGIREHVFYNISAHISHLNIEDLFIHNPPIFLENSLKLEFSDKIVTDGDKYESLSTDKFKQFQELVNQNILGQERAILSLQNRIAYSLVGNSKKKPIIILLYGDSGVGKTQTAKYLAEALGGEPFRKQMSMFQSTESQRYLFGGEHSEKSFARDLIGRETNVILLDEFDKVHTIFHNAFYQFFDEGVYVDTNYSVEIDNAIIICTSNYTDTKQIKSVLGEAIYSRFDAIIKYESLGTEIIKEIIHRQIELEYSLLSDEQKSKITKDEIIKFFQSFTDSVIKAEIRNARNAKNQVQAYIGKKLVEMLDSMDQEAIQD